MPEEYSRPNAALALGRFNCGEDGETPDPRSGITARAVIKKRRWWDTGDLKGKLRDPRSPTPTTQKIWLGEISFDSILFYESLIQTGFQRASVRVWLSCMEHKVVLHELPKYLDWLNFFTWKQWNDEWGPISANVSLFKSCRKLFGTKYFYRGRNTCLALSGESF